MTKCKCILLVCYCILPQGKGLWMQQCNYLIWKIPAEPLKVCFIHYFDQCLYDMVPWQNKKKKPRGNVKKAEFEGKRVEKEESAKDQKELELRQGGGRNPREMMGNWSQKPSQLLAGGSALFHPSWRSSESEYSDTEGGANAKLRYDMFFFLFIYA